MMESGIDKTDDMVDDHVRRVQDEATGKAKPALDYTGGKNIYDTAARILNKKNRQVRGKTWTYADRKKLKALVAGRVNKAIDWDAVSKELCKSAKACSLKAYALNYVRKTKGVRHRRQPVTKAPTTWPSKQRPHRVGVSCPSCGGNVNAVFAGDKKLDVQYCKKCDKLYKVTLQAIEMGV